MDSSGSRACKRALKSPRTAEKVPHGTRPIADERPSQNSALEVAVASSSICVGAYTPQRRMLSPCEERSATKSLSEATVVARAKGRNSGGGNHQSYPGLFRAARGKEVKAIRNESR